MHTYWRAPNGAEAYRSCILNVTSISAMRLRLPGCHNNNRANLDDNCRRRREDHDRSSDEDDRRKSHEKPREGDNANTHTTSTDANSNCAIQHAAISIV